MAPVTIDLEIPSPVPAPKLFHALIIDFDVLVPKIAPQSFKSVEIIHGDGGVGTIKLVKLGDGVPFDTAKHRVDGIDKENFTHSFTIIEGDLLLDSLESVTHHFKFEPSSHGGSVFKHKTVYHLKAGKELTDENIQFGKDQVTILFKAVEGYILANPGAY